MKRIVVSPFGSVRSRLNPGSTVTSNQRLQNRQIRDFFSELSPSHCGAGNLFCSRWGLWIPLKLPGLLRLPKLRHDLLAKSTFGTLALMPSMSALKGEADMAVRIRMSASDLRRTFPSPQLSGYTNIIRSGGLELHGVAER
jgi:hypothetical protein